MPLWLALCVVIGVLVGTFYANHFSGNRLNIINSGSSRLSNLLHIIDDQYVDSVNIDELVDKALPQILAELDPHSVYISAKDVQMATEDLKGSFSGVGIEFTIQQDTLHIQNVIKNGPAEKAGILAGDKIVSIDDKPFVGDSVTNEEAQYRLKGPKDSKVKIGIKRFGEKNIKYFVLTRNDIPMKSISATYMLNDSIGYIRIKNFGERTYAEMLSSLQQLNLQGADKLVIDLRDNSGGYLESAVQMAEEFLKKNQLVVYTQGRKSPRREYRSRGKGSYQQIPLVVLINEGSASASEIFAGALIWERSGSTANTVPRRQHDSSDNRTLLYSLGQMYTETFQTGRHCRIRTRHADTLSTWRIFLSGQHQAYWSRLSHRQRPHSLWGRRDYTGHIHTGRHYRRNLVLQGSCNAWTSLAICVQIYRREPSDFK